MIRVYIDWNVLTQMKNAEDGVYKSILDKLEEYKPHLIIQYSPSHISDLMKGWNKTPEVEELTRKDLKFLSKITDNRFIVQYWNQEQIRTKSVDPEDYFDEAKEDHNIPWAERMDFTKIFDESEMTEELKLAVTKLKSLKFESDGFTPPNSEDAKFKFPFPTYKKGQPVFEFFQEIASHMERIMKEPEAYKNLRGIVRDGIPLDKNLSNWENVYDRLDEELPKTVLGKSFTQHVADATKTKTKYQTNKRQDFFTNSYMQLDMLGYRPDKITKKNTHENLLNDANHAFYAAHCDVYVSNDEKASAKCKALYDKCGIQTKLYTPQEFLQNIDSHVKVFPTAGEWFQHWMSVIKDSVSTYEAHDFKEENVSGGTILLKEKILDYFNTCLTEFYPDGVTSYTLYWREVHYGNYILYEEVDNILQKLFKFLGPDVDGRGEYVHEKDSQEISEKIWPGRRWLYQELRIGIFYQDRLQLIFYWPPVSNQDDNAQELPDATQ